MIIGNNWFHADFQVAGTDFLLMGRPPKNSKKKRKVKDPSFKRKGAFARFLTSQVDEKGDKILTKKNWENE